MLARCMQGVGDLGQPAKKSYMLTNRKLLKWSLFSMLKRAHGKQF